MFGFYIFGMSDMQDMIPILLTSLKRGKECWVCIFDTVLYKRQLYYYEPEEITNFIKSICVENELPIPRINFYSVNAEARFKNDYQSISPKLVFIQNIVHKNISWYPTAKGAKVIHLAWHKDGARHAGHSSYNIFLNVLRKEYDLHYFGAHGIDKIPKWFRNRIGNLDQLLEQKSRYYGNFRLEQLSYKKVLSKFPSYESLVDKKICFIVESHLRNDLIFRKNTGLFVDQLIDFLHENDYYVIWKTREKGWPKDKWCSPLDVATQMPDFIIEKDLNFPTSLIHGPTIADVCLTINCTNAIFDLQEINHNSFILSPAKLPEHEELIYQRRFKGQAERLQMLCNDDWKLFLKAIGQKPPKKIEIQTSTEKLLEDLEGDTFAEGD